VCDLGAQSWPELARLAGDTSCGTSSGCRGGEGDPGGVKPGVTERSGAVPQGSARRQRGRCTGGTRGPSCGCSRGRAACRGRGAGVPAAERASRAREVPFVLPCRKVLNRSVTPGRSSAEPAVTASAAAPRRPGGSSCGRAPSCLPRLYSSARVLRAAAFALPSARCKWKFWLLTSL